jgi:outer membrane protease
VDVIDATMFDINLSLAVAAEEGYSLSVVGGIMVDMWEWDDRGQEFIYSVESFRDTIGSFEGRNVIDYEQTFVIPYIGVEAAADLGGISIQGWLIYSSVTLAEDKDHHILRGLHFRETFDGGDYIAFGASATLDINDVLFVQGSLESQEVKEIIGDMEIEETGTSNEDGAGISHEAMMISVGIGMRL